MTDRSAKSLASGRELYQEDIERLCSAESFGSNKPQEATLVLLLLLLLSYRVTRHVLVSLRGGSVLLSLHKQASWRFANPEGDVPRAAATGRLSSNCIIGHIQNRRDSLMWKDAAAAPAQAPTAPTAPTAVLGCGAGELGLSQPGSPGVSWCLPDQSQVTLTVGTTSTIGFKPVLPDVASSRSAGAQFEQHGSSSTSIRATDPASQNQSSAFKALLGGPLEQPRYIEEVNQKHTQGSPLRPLVEFLLGYMHGFVITCPWKDEEEEEEEEEQKRG
ncbi:unnamed protein product [Pleuronectes platessa]|uniref:Uncharacterized protein n=1 Tax=Pleuronectes platessa TaxID=8262 RepID=A0A9N7YL02_PLEPL|nr:unnamed protein product [Pleuronectes platessa]